jgi:flagellar biosynthesis regulator FlaF
MKTEKTKVEKKDRPSVSLINEVTLLRKEKHALEKKRDEQEELIQYFKNGWGNEIEERIPERKRLAELEAVIVYFGIWQKRKVLNI